MTSNDNDNNGRRPPARVASEFAAIIAPSTRADVALARDAAVAAVRADACVRGIDVDASTVRASMRRALRDVDVDAAAAVEAAIERALDGDASVDVEDAVAVLRDLDWRADGRRIDRRATAAVHAGSRAAARANEASRVARSTRREAAVARTIACHADRADVAVRDGAAAREAAGQRVRALRCAYNEIRRTACYRAVSLLLRAPSTAHADILATITVHAVIVRRACVRALDGAQRTKFDALPAAVRAAVLGVDVPTTVRTVQIASDRAAAFTVRTTHERISLVLTDTALETLRR